VLHGNLCRPLAQGRYANQRNYILGDSCAGPNREVAVKVTEIWRYPVKTMAGEKLQQARIGPLGIEGDRVVHVEDARGRVITSRSHPRFLARLSQLRGSFG
jgi:hypothetical protein